MASEPMSVWTPDWAVPPGEVLLEALDDRGLTQSELARRLDRPIKTVNEIIKGKAAITPDTAIQLERTLGISARFWNALETNYREALAHRRARNELMHHRAWARRFPIKELARYGHVPSPKTTPETIDALLRFFGISRPVAWETRRLQLQASFRASPTFKADPDSVAVWLRWGEVAAADIECQPFDAQRLRAFLAEMRKLTTVSPVSHAVNRLRDLCAECGVALVLVPELPGAPLSGAARWISADKALIQLSLRHKRDDQFWFTFFHEVDHLLETEKSREDVVEGVNDPTAEDKRERRVNEFARNVLIPPEKYDDFIAQADVSTAAVRAFALSVGIAAGIVVGRLQHDKVIDRPKLDTLKRPMRWMEPPLPRS